MGFDTLSFVLGKSSVPKTVLQEKSVTPTAEGFSVFPDEGYSGLSAVNVEGDENLVSENIVSGVSIFGVEGNAETGGGTEIADGVDPYYQQLAEAVMTRNAKYLGDEKKLSMKGFVLSNGNTLASLNGYSFAGFRTVESMIFSDVVIVQKDAFVGDTALKIIDITATQAMPYVSFMQGSLNGCTALESVIIRDGGAGIQSAMANASHGGSDTFYFYVPSAYYDTVIAKLDGDVVPAERYRKLEDYPEIDHWNEE